MSDRILSDNHKLTNRMENKTTYSTYARGLDGLWGMYQWLDRAPKGRNETGIWWRRHDEYGSLPESSRSFCHASEARA